jgi:hypothetical protein
VLKKYLGIGIQWGWDAEIERLAILTTALFVEFPA